jgi:hypothetical protein
VVTDIVGGQRRDADDNAREKVHHAPRMKTLAFSVFVARGDVRPGDILAALNRGLTLPDFGLLEPGTCDQGADGLTCRFRVTVRTGVDARAVLRTLVRGAFPDAESRIVVE